MRRSVFYKPGDEDTIQMTVVKVTAVQKELEEYEATKNLSSKRPSRLQHYKIEEVIEL